MDFIIDTVGDDELQVKTELLDENDKSFIAMEAQARTTHQQFLKIIEFMERYGDISYHRNGVDGQHLRNQILWQKLATTLNSVEGGVRKPSLRWKKVWSDLKNNTKKKYRSLKQKGKLGGIGVNKKYLSPTETRVLALLNDTSIHSNELPSSKKDVSIKTNSIHGNQLPTVMRDEPPQSNENNEDMGEMELIYVPLESDKEDKTQSILSLFNKKKQELDAVASAEEELQKKLDSLKIDNLFDDFFTEMSWNNSSVLSKSKKKKRRLFHFEQLDLETGKLKSNLGGVDVEKEMQKSVLKPGVEKEHRLPSYHVSEKKLKAMRKKEREKTKGPGWFDMKAPEVTEELKNDLNILKMRSVLDPKHFYKKNDMEVLPKYFQVGTIMDSALDHVNERLTRKERKRTMVDELLADAEFQKYNKKKYKEIIDEKRKTEYRTFMKDKRQKNKTALKSNKLKPKKSVK